MITVGHFNWQITLLLDTTYNQQHKMLSPGNYVSLTKTMTLNYSNEKYNA